MDRIITRQRLEGLKRIFPGFDTINKLNDGLRSAILKKCAQDEFGSGKGWFWNTPRIFYTHFEMHDYSPGIHCDPDWLSTKLNSPLFGSGEESYQLYFGLFIFANMDIESIADPLVKLGWERVNAIAFLRKVQTMARSMIHDRLTVQGSGLESLRDAPVD